MIEQFEVKPSGLIVIYSIFVHALTLLCVLSFDIPVMASSVAVFLISVSFVAAVRSQKQPSSCSIKYESKYPCWNICWNASADEQVWQRYETVKIAYLNDTFVWIIMNSPNNVSRAVLIGVDSLPNERFLQLRRCILCPTMFKD